MHKNKIPGTSSKSTGNAVAEFVVVAAVMVPALLAIPVLGKLGSAGQTADQISRYAVWERTVTPHSEKNDELLSREIHQRFFFSDLALIDSDPDRADLSFDSAYLARMNADGERISILAGGEDSIALVTRNQNIPNAVKGKEFIEAVAKVGATLEKLVPNAKWDLKADGFYTVDLNLELGNQGLYTKNKDCAGDDSDQVYGCIRKRAAIFTDTWDASSPAHTERRVRALVPAGALEPIGKGLSVMGNLPLTKELKGLRNAFGHVDADVLPNDRHGDPE